MTGAANRRRLRVGVCAPYDLGRAGGVNTHIRAQARALRRLGHEVVVFGTSSRPLESGEVSIGGCISLVIGGTDTALGFDPRMRRRIAALYRERQFDLVHVHEPLMPLAPWLAVLGASGPVVGTFHVYRERGHRWYRPYRPVLAPVMRRLDARIAVSDAARRTIAEHFPGDYTVVPNAIDLTRFEPPAERPPEMTAGRPSVLFVGRLEPRKGVACLIDAMAMVQRRLPACRLIIVGDGPERRTLEELARHAAVDVSWVGAVSDEMLPAYYGAADVFCSPAVGDESFGLVLLEAMAARRPIVASRIQGYAELLGTAECAQLVEPGNPAALADAICGLLRDPDLRRTMGLRAASFAEAYDWNAIARRLEAIYIGILSRYAPARALA